MLSVNFTKAASSASQSISIERPLIVNHNYESKLLNQTVMNHNQINDRPTEIAPKPLARQFGRLHWSLIFNKRRVALLVDFLIRTKAVR